MDSKQKAVEWSSIDENPVTGRSIDTNLARKNLQRLQDHVNKQFSYRPCGTGLMSAGNNPQQPYSNLLGKDLIQRPPSIKDDDELFRGESDSEQSDNALDDQTDDINKRAEKESDKTYSESNKHCDIEPACELEYGTASDHTGVPNIPDFSRIGLSFSTSSKGSETVGDQLAVEFVSQAVKSGNSEVESESIEVVSRKTSDSFKNQYRSKRSVSDIKEKRKRFSQHEDYAIEEVFDENYPVPVRKSNSLPDLILSLSSSGSGSERKSPDLVLFDKQKDILQERKTFKDSFEGKSSFEKPAHSESVFEKRKPSLGRSVSFNDKTDCRYYQTGEPGLSCTVYETGETQNLDDKSFILDRPSSNSKKGDQEKKEETPPQTPTSTVEGRRQLFSKSSGYHTGSDQSRESHDTQNESFHDDTFQGDYNASQDQKLHRKDCEGTTGESETLFKNFDGKSMSDSSNDTIVSLLIDESLRYENDLRGASIEFNTDRCDKDSVEGPPTELPFLSIMDRSPQSSLNGYRIEKKTIGSICSEENTCGEQKSGVSEEDHLRLNVLEFKRSQSTLGHSVQSSLGNVPNLGMLDESVIVDSSNLAKVDEEDKKQTDHIKKKYLNPLNPGGSMDKGLEESMLAMMSRQSLSSYLQLPSDLMRNELEQIMGGPISDVETIQQAIHRLLESGSSSPGPSPFELGDGRHSISSPRSKQLRVEELERASRCSDPKCSEPACERMRQFQILLQLDLDEADTTNHMLIPYLEAIYLHRQRCEELMCPVLYCQKCLEWCPHGYDPISLLQNIKYHMKNPLGYLEQTSEPRFLKLQDRIGDTIPQQFITYIPLTMSLESGKSLLAQDLQTRSLCIIREYPLFEDNHQIRALRSLRNLNHPHVVPQLWLLEYSEENVIHICTQFMQGGSLREFLDVAEQLSWLQIVTYLKQITDAVCFLHAREVIFLYWESNYMMFPNTRRDTIMLGDFAFSHHEDGEPDIGALKQCLPYNICPPELLNGNTVSKNSDSWGLACLLAEMLTLTPVWFELRHEDRESAHKKIIESMESLPVEGPLPVEEEMIFQCCWKMDPSERSSISDVNRLLNTFLSKQLSRDSSGP